MDSVDNQASGRSAVSPQAEMEPGALRETLSTGLMAFPLTDFDGAGDFDKASFGRRVEWLNSHSPKALFVAGGTGEGFSLTPAEHVEVVRAAVEASAGTTTIIAGVGYSTRLAVEMAQQAERAGAAGILLLPHYLTEASQAGLAAHVEAVCAAVRIGVIAYNRNVCRLAAGTIEMVADRCPNLIGLKDGIGDLELITSIRSRLGGRLAYLGGMPTAEIYAEPYRAAGVAVYSSAAFNFIPRTATEFYLAVKKQDHVTTDRLLKNFFLPFIGIRNREPGYAVAAVKAGARLVGRAAGPVRPPLSDLTANDERDLEALLVGLGSR